MTEPAQKPGRSRQDYSTPVSFLEAIGRRFGTIDFDLAARADNCVAPAFFSREQDALSQSWELPGVRVAFLNPEFAHIDPWAKKVSECRMLARWTLMLVPASIDSHWYRDHILGKTMVWGIPRIQFVDATASYPKALMLVGAGFGVVGNSFWQWNKNEAAQVAA